MNKFDLISLTLFSLVFSLISCSDSSNDNTTKNDHVWKTQTDTLKQANDLAEQLNEEFKRKEKQLQDARQ